MADNDGKQWYVLESMKATTIEGARNGNTNTAINANQNYSKNWFSLDGMHGSETKNQPQSSHHQAIITSTMHGNSAFDSSDCDDTLSINTNSLLQYSKNDENQMASPSNTRLILQESVDGEISDSQNSSNSSKSKTNISFNNQHLSDANEGGNNTSLLLQEAENQASVISTSINNTTEYTHSKHLEDQQWMSLTSSNIQEVNRPEPLGRTTDQVAINNQVSSSINMSSIRATASVSNSTSVAGSASPINSLIESHNNKTEITQSLSSKTESDIQELSYTQSSISIDGQTSYTAGSQHHGSQLTSSKISTETPVTKLLGPAYKETEKFLKDLKKMKLSYRDSSLSNDGNPEVYLDRKTSKDESCQAGESKLKFSRISLNNDENDFEGKNDLIEQDIASASLLDFETGTTDTRNKKMQHYEDGHSSTDDQRESGGELLVTELSSLSVQRLPITTSSLHGSSSGGKSYPSSQVTLSSLEPIKEILSPDRRVVSGTGRITISSPTHADDYFQTGSISSTSTPQISNVSLSKQIRPHGIYDIRDSTSPGSSNRKRLVSGKLPKVSKSDNHQHDPFKVYVSDNSKLLSSMESTALQEVNEDSYGIHKTFSKNIPKSVDLHHSLINDVAKELQGINDISEDYKTNSAVHPSRSINYFNTSAQKRVIKAMTGVQVPSLNSFLDISHNETSSSHRDTTDLFLNSTEDSTIATTPEGATTTTRSTDDSSLPSGDTTMTPSYKNINSQSKKQHSYKPINPSMSFDYVGRYTLRNSITNTHNGSGESTQGNLNTPKKQHSLRKASRQRELQHQQPQQQVNIIENEVTVNTTKKNTSDAGQNLKTDHQIDLEIESSTEICLRREIINEKRLAQQQSYSITPSYSKEDINSRSGENTYRILPHDSRNSKGQMNFKTKRESKYNKTTEKEKHQQPRSTSSTKVKGSEENNTNRSKSLNELWNSFEKTYKDANKEKSPLLKKLEKVSSILNDSQRPSHLPDLSSSSDVDSSASKEDIHKSFAQLEKKQLDTRRQHSTKGSLNLLQQPYSFKKSSGMKQQSFTKKSSNKNINNISSNNNHTRSSNGHVAMNGNDNSIATNNVCPLCQRREVGTNYPTPSMFDKDVDPLTLQTWTQTSPYIIDADLVMKNIGFPKEEIVSNRMDTKLVRKETYTLFHQDKSRLEEKYHPRQKSKKDIPYTAWFHSIRSDVTEVTPLTNVPVLSSLYRESQDKILEEGQKENVVPVSSLQDAFLKHKQRFIRRSKQRQQEVKDARLQEKHAERVEIHQTRGKNENIWFVNVAKAQVGRKNKIHKKSKEKRGKMKERFFVDSLRYAERSEEIRMKNIKNNRLKMKQYDLKNREHFLKRRTKGVVNRQNFFVVRH